MPDQGDIITYLEMCAEEGVNLQKGMNFHLKANYSVILMSVRPGAPYADRVEDNGRILIYEGHDIPNKAAGPDPKRADQPMHNPGGSLTENGKFYEAAMNFRKGKAPADVVKVYEKLKSGIWVFNGYFRLVDALLEMVQGRRVFKFRLELLEDYAGNERNINQIPHTRMIPSWVKAAVWKRDKGRCVQCGRTDNLHFDHVLPFSRGGSSLTPENIQLLCVRHNLAKSNRIE